MKTTRDILQEYIDMYADLIKMNKDEVKVVLFSGVKPSSYYVPQPMAYRDHPPYRDSQLDSADLSWFVEIWVDGICVWRKSMCGEDLKQYEEQLMEETIRDIMIYGLSTSYIDTKERRKNFNQFTGI
jgi:hypothetical protein